MIDGLAAVVSATDRDGRYLFINRFHARLFGIEQEQASGRRPCEFGLVHHKPVGQSAGRCKDEEFAEEHLTDREGRRRTLLTTAVALNRDRDQDAHTLQIALDISERKEAEARALSGSARSTDRPIQPRDIDG